MKLRHFIFMMLSGLWGSRAMADVPNQVIIHYTGNVVVNPCTLSTSVLNIGFGDIDASTFSTLDSASAERYGDIKFSNCDKDTTLDIDFYSNGPTYMATTPAHPCGLFNSRDMQDSRGWPVLGVEAKTVVDNKIIDLACTPKISIYPKQRAISDVASYDLQMKFRLIRINPSLGGAAMNVKNSMGMIIVASYR